MSRLSILAFCIAGALAFSSCSPRDFISRRLAADLIAGSPTFRAPQPFQMRIGVVSNKDRVSPEYLSLQHRGWISTATAPCPPALAPPPCAEVTLTPSGVETIQGLIAPGDADKQSFAIPAARREVVAINGIAKQGDFADVEFTWRWIPLNEVGAILYSGDHRYKSTVSFRNYDDGWRVVESTPHPTQTLDEALKNAEPMQ